MKVITIVGARPQFIKCAPVSYELRKVGTEILVHTGQHYDAAMSDVFFKQLSIPEPDYNLDVRSGHHGAQTAKMLEGIEAILLKEQADCCMVYGDTNSTLAGALAAAKLRVPVVHVEAGLRSFNRDMPEEINRITADHLADVCFCPTESSVQHLAVEGIQENVHLVGDVMLDAFRRNLEMAKTDSKILSHNNLTSKEFVLATVHRAENTDRAARLHAIVDAFNLLAERGVTIVWPVHPRTRERLTHFSGQLHSNVKLIEPVDYLDMLSLEHESSVILTDSGGVQKEAYWSRVPCVTLREETEWTETIQSGWNVLVGVDCNAIVQAALSAQPSDNVISVWEEHEASKEIVQQLVSRYSRDSKSEDRAA